MSENRVLVLGSSERSYSALRFLVEANARGTNLDSIGYADISFRYENRILLIAAMEDNESILSYSHYIFRSSMPRYHAIKNAVVTAIGDDKFVLNRRAFDINIGYYNKLVQLVRLSEAGLPLVPTRMIPSAPGFRQTLVSVLDNGSAFIKPLSGSHGSGAIIVENISDADTITDEQVSTLFIQDYMPIESDYRIIVLGDNVIGAMRRTKADGEIVSNVQRGGIVSPCTLDTHVEDIAIEAARAMGMEFCGVDILIHDDKPYVLEVNTMPQFEGFERATGANVAGLVLEYMMCK